MVKESLRKYAPINLFPRLVENDDVLPTGHVVTAGDLVLLSSWAMGRNPRVWERPDDFDPDRFTDANIRVQSERLARESAGPEADEVGLSIRARPELHPLATCNLDTKHYFLHPNSLMLDS